MFKWLLDNSLSNRLLVIIASLVLMAYGAFTLSRTPVDVFPDLNKPTVTIMTEAGGMAAEEVEQLLTFPLETTMNGLPASSRYASGGPRPPHGTINALSIATHILPEPFFIERATLDFPANRDAPIAADVARRRSPSRSVLKNWRSS